MEINKVSLSAYDDKRYILDDGITSYAYGHYKTLKASFWWEVIWLLEQFRLLLELSFDYD